MHGGGVLEPPLEVAADDLGLVQVRVDHLRMRTRVRLRMLLLLLLLLPVPHVGRVRRVRPRWRAGGRFKVTCISCLNQEYYQV